MDNIALEQEITRLKVKVKELQARRVKAKYPYHLHIRVDLVLFEGIADYGRKHSLTLSEAIRKIMHKGLFGA